MKVHKWTNNDISFTLCSRDGGFKSKTWDKVTCKFCLMKRKK